MPVYKKIRHYAISHWVWVWGLGAGGGVGVGWGLGVGVFITSHQLHTCSQTSLIHIFILFCVPRNMNTA